MIPKVAFIITLILFSAIIFYIFNEVRTLKTTMERKIDKLLVNTGSGPMLENISNTIHNTVGKYVQTIKSVGENNLNELKNITKLNYQPIRKVNKPVNMINHYTEVDCSDMSSNFMSDSSPDITFMQKQDLFMSEDYKSIPNCSILDTSPLETSDMDKTTAKNTNNSRALQSADDSSDNSLFKIPPYPSTHCITEGSYTYEDETSSEDSINIPILNSTDKIKSSNCDISISSDNNDIPILGSVDNIENNSTSNDDFDSALIDSLVNTTKNNTIIEPFDMDTQNNNIIQECVFEDKTDVECVNTENENNNIDISTSKDDCDIMETSNDLNFDVLLEKVVNDNLGKNEHIVETNDDLTVDVLLEKVISDDNERIEIEKNDDNNDIKSILTNKSNKTSRTSKSKKRICFDLDNKSSHDENNENSKDQTIVDKVIQNKKIGPSKNYSNNELKEICKKYKLPLSTKDGDTRKIYKKAELYKNIKSHLRRINKS